MCPTCKRRTGGKASLLALFLTLLLPIQQLYGFQQPATAAPANAGAQPPGAQPPQQDIGWPRQVSKEGATLVYYQPQIDDWKDYQRIFFRMAFQLTPSGGKAVMGVASIEANTTVDKDKDAAYLRDITVTSARFPSLDPDTSAKMEQLLKKLVPTGSEAISVERLIADMDKDKGKSAAQPVKVENNPPQIFHSDKPAILLMVQDKPVLAPIEKTNLQFVVNTNWNLFFDKDKKTYYLLVENGWLSTQSLEGQWAPIQKLPKDFEKLPEKEWAEIKKMVPAPPPSGTVPHVFYSNKPAELLLFKGQPVYTKIPGTQLLYVANTENDVFVDNAQKQFYVLLSGRWFRAGSLDGPWNYAGNDLPADFAKIPADSPKANVLASVPGTIQAADAVLLAQIPNTAMVNKKEAAANVKVDYGGGKAEFKPIEGTSMQYATNTQEQVVKVGDLYYLCFQGVWFKSTQPNGPWETADSVPKEIYTIPPSSPVYNVTYVKQESKSEDEVECSHTAGYLGMFVIGMTAGLAIGYGTGYYYPGYVYWGGGYPYYRAWPATYGMAYRYNGYGAYGVGRAAYGPYGGVGSSAWYNPATGRYGRTTSAQGRYGGRTTGTAYNPWTGARGATVQGHNAYSQWGRSTAVRGNQWAQTGHVSTARGTAGAYRSSQGAGVGYRGTNGSVARTSNGVYAGNDGNVYRRNSNGSWSQYNNSSRNWNQVDAGKQAQAQQRAQEARGQAGSQIQQSDRAQNAQNARANGSSQLPQGDRSQAAQNVQSARQSGSTPKVSSDTMQGLNNSAQSRQRGQAQSQRFQSSGRSGGSGRAARGGGGRRR